MAEFNNSNIILFHELRAVEATLLYLREKIGFVAGQAERGEQLEANKANVQQLAYVLDYLADNLRASVGADLKVNKVTDPMVVPPGVTGYISYNADKFDVMDGKLYNRASGTVVAVLNGAATRPFYETNPAPVGDDLK